MIDRRDALEARKAIGDSIRRTPLVESEFLSRFCDASVHLKLENLQITNSFKIRGALNRILHLSEEEKRRGVITASAGNHAQAVAIATEKLDLPAKILVPRNTPQIKIDKIKKHQVELILYGDVYDEAEEKAIELARQEGLTYVSPYNDQFVIAGQGTIGLEILEDLPGVNTIIVPVGGGGLVSGIAVAVKSTNPSVEVVGVQSESSPVIYESLRAGRIVTCEMRESIAEGLHGGIEKGSMTFDIIRRHVDAVLLVREETIRKAVYLLWRQEKQVVEGAGAAAIAPILERRNLFKGKTIVAVLSGGNIDNKLFQEILATEKESFDLT